MGTLSSWLRTGKVIKDTPVVVHNIHPKRKLQKGRRRTVLLEGEHVVAVPSETASVDRSSHPCLAYSFA